MKRAEKISELIKRLQVIEAASGDLDVYGHDMDAIMLELCEGGEAEDADSPTAGKTYLCVG